MEICKQQIEIEMRHLPAISIYGYVGGLWALGSETLPFACYIHSDESSIPFYSTSNGYNKWNVQRMFLFM